MTSRPWTADDMPDLSGKTIVVTGGNAGLGYEAARKFAHKGGDVLLACRDPTKARHAVEGILSESPGAAVRAMRLDLADLSSVRQFADDFRATRGNLHVLCNNAGVMAIPLRRTADGFEMQFGTNHLGHFALTGLLLEPLLSAGKARVVTVSSVAHWAGWMQLKDPNWQRRYWRWPAYAQSKLANLLFAFELQRKAASIGARLLSVGCHPGYSATDLQLVGPRMDESVVMEKLAALLNRFVAQTAEMGALPILYAATAEGVCGGDCIAPDGPLESWGYPKKVVPGARARDERLARQLWDLSEALTGVRYEALCG